MVKTRSGAVFEKLPSQEKLLRIPQGAVTKMRSTIRRCSFRLKEKNDKNEAGDASNSAQQGSFSRMLHVVESKQLQTSGRHLWSQENEPGKGSRTTKGKREHITDKISNHLAPKKEMVKGLMRLRSSGRVAKDTRLVHMSIDIPFIKYVVREKTYGRVTKVSLAKPYGARKRTFRLTRTRTTEKTLKKINNNEDNSVKIKSPHLNGRKKKTVTSTKISSKFEIETHRSGTNEAESSKVFTELPRRSLRMKRKAYMNSLMTLTNTDNGITHAHYSKNVSTLRTNTSKEQVKTIHEKPGKENETEFTTKHASNSMNISSVTYTHKAKRKTSLMKCPLDSSSEPGNIRNEERKAASVRRVENLKESDTENKKPEFLITRFLRSTPKKSDESRFSVDTETKKKLTNVLPEISKHVMTSPTTITSTMVMTSPTMRSTHFVTTSITAKSSRIMTRSATKLTSTADTTYPAMKSTRFMTTSSIKKSTQILETSPTKITSAVVIKGPTKKSTQIVAASPTNVTSAVVLTSSTKKSTQTVATSPTKITDLIVSATPTKKSTPVVTTSPTKITDVIVSATPTKKSTPVVTTSPTNITDVIVSATPTKKSSLDVTTSSTKKSSLDVTTSPTKELIQVVKISPTEKTSSLSSSNIGSPNKTKVPSPRKLITSPKKDHAPNFNLNPLTVRLLEGNDLEDVEELLDIDESFGYSPTPEAISSVPAPPSHPPPMSPQKPRKMSYFQKQVVAIKQRMKAKLEKREKMTDANSPSLFLAEIFPLKKPPHAADVAEEIRRIPQGILTTEELEKIPVVHYYLNKANSAMDPALLVAQKKKITEGIMGDIKRIRHLQSTSNLYVDDGQIPGPSRSPFPDSQEREPSKIKWRDPLVRSKRIPFSYEESLVEMECEEKSST